MLKLNGLRISLEKRVLYVGLFTGSIEKGILVEIIRKFLYDLRYKLLSG